MVGILFNKRVICKLTITPTYKMAVPMWSKILPPCGHKIATTRYPAGEGSWELSSLEGRAVRDDQASRGGKLRMTGPAEKGSWGEPGLKGRAVRGDQACRGG